MPLQLLVIEDRLSDFELVTSQLERQGLAATFRRVDNPEGLRDALQQQSWDAVLTDYNIPGMVFQDTVALLRERLPGVPILLVSGYMGEDQAAVLLQLGIADYVLKYRLARLRAAIERAVAVAQEQRARQAAEAALRQQTDYLMALIDSLPFRVWLKDTDGRYLAVNRHHAAAYGRVPQDLIGKTEFELVDEATARERVARDRDAIENRRPLRRDTRSEEPAGAGWIESYHAPVFDQSGNVLGTVGYAFDFEADGQPQPLCQHGHEG